MGGITSATSRTRSAVSGAQLTRGFAVRSALAFLAVGLVVHVVVGAQVNRKYETFAEFHAEFVAESVLAHELTGRDLLVPASGQRQTELAAFTEDFVNVGDVTHIRIWRPDATVLFSDDSALVGRQFPAEAERLEAALAKGTVTRAGEQFVTTVPMSGWLVDIHQDRGPTMAAAAAFTRILGLVLLLGLAVLYLLTLPIARRVGDRLTRQLAREQETVSRLEHLDQMKTTFLTAVSHELRTPLTVLRGAAMTLQQRWRDMTDDVRDDLTDQLVSNAGRLDGLLASLLDLDRLSRGVVEPDTVAVSVGSVVERALERQRSAQLSVTVSDACVLADPGHLERIVENLVANALRHTPTGTSVHVRDEAADGGVVLVVEDDGPGIPAELREELFQPFRQGPSADTHSPPAPA